MISDFCKAFSKKLFTVTVETRDHKLINDIFLVYFQDDTIEYHSQGTHVSDSQPESAQSDSDSQPKSAESDSKMSSIIKRPRDSDVSHVSDSQPESAEESDSDMSSIIRPIVPV